MSPHVYLLGLMFADKVFSIDSLTPERLYKLEIRSGCNQLVVPIKDEAADLWVFRRYEQIATKREMSNDQLPYATIKTHLKDIGHIAGFREVLKPYSFRYGTGNAFDRSLDVSSNMRNGIMNHSNDKVFKDHYFSRTISLDVQAVVRSTQPQRDLIQAACSMSRSIDPNRPRYLTSEQKQSIAKDPEIQKMEKRLKQNSMNIQEYEKCKRDIRNKKQRMRYQILRQSRRDYEKTQPEKDIQQQLLGKGFEEKMETVPKESQRTQGHERLILAATSPPESSVAAEMTRKVEAINAVKDYCSFEEGEMPRRRAEDPCANYKPQETDDTRKKAIEEAKDVFFKENRPKICFICLGNEGLVLEKRLYCFASPGDLSKHFKRHLMQFNESKGEECRLCKVHLSNSLHMRRHAFEQHGTVSNNFR
ncbi:hypothetical protein yc1106_09465 [Curvularia clavata]|uniref:C2H2-type domain-containing protein n=1 Tax=Curvularia clavata TaxID=95742 RepID=A0A9Q9DY48_CURCL|nr:hypothetical protein yc1106_09465 [Curvularia clavata]